MMHMANPPSLRPEPIGSIQNKLVEGLSYLGVSTSSTRTECVRNRREFSLTLPGHHTQKTTVRPEPIGSIRNKLVEEFLYLGVSTSSTRTECGRNRSEFSPKLTRYHVQKTTVRPEPVEGPVPLGEFPSPLQGITVDLPACGLSRAASGSIRVRERGQAQSTRGGRLLHPHPNPPPSRGRGLTHGGDCSFPITPTGPLLHRVGTKQSTQSPPPP
jgi:hypothetical protein